MAYCISFLRLYQKWQYIKATHLAQSAWVSWMKRRDGVQQSQSNKCCWGSKTCWIHQIPIVLLNQKLTIFSSITKLSTSDEWRRRHERILLARKWDKFSWLLTFIWWPAYWVKHTTFQVNFWHSNDSQYSGWATMIEGNSGGGENFQVI